MIAIKNIVVATDFGDAAATALTYGRDLAQAYSATLHVVHVADDLAASAPLTELPVDFTRLQADLEREALTALNGLVAEDRQRDFVVKPMLLTAHSPARAILTYAIDVKADLIVIGTHGRSGLAQFFLGSVAQKIVRSATCPVLTVRTDEREFVHPDALSVVDHGS